MVRKSLLAALCATVLAIVLGAGSVAASADASVHPEWGSTHARDGVLKQGCHTYHYQYSIDPPPGDWALEIFIVGPGGKQLANSAFVGGYDPKVGGGSYTLCKVSTRYGRFTIRAKLSVQDGPQGYVEGWLPPSHFRLHAPG